MDKISLSIIIVNYNTGDLLYKCLDSIKDKIKNIDHQVIIVDNASSDNSWKIVNKFLEYTLIRNEKNIGFGECNNRILKTIKSKYILLLNPDTELTEGSIEKMLEFMQTHQKVGIIGPKVLYPNGRLQRTAFLFPTVFSILLGILFLNKLFPKSKIFNKQNFGHWNYHNIREVDAVSGCCLLLRKKVYDNIGGLDEDYLFFYDDIDFCKRAKNNNWKVVFFPKNTIYHFGGGSFTTDRYIPVYFGRRSKILFFKKYHSNWSTLLVSLLTFIEVIARIPIIGILYLINKKHINKTRLRAYLDTLKFILTFRY